MANADRLHIHYRELPVGYDLDAGPDEEEEGIDTDNDNDDNDGDDVYAEISALLAKTYI